jgi:hypothetical protein
MDPTQAINYETSGPQDTNLIPDLKLDNISKTTTKAEKEAKIDKITKITKTQERQ